MHQENIVPAEHIAQHEMHTLYNTHHHWLRDWLRAKLGNHFLMHV
ncbi:hypothetical protein Q7C_2552 [Methylophaga frappieri]|uniref:Uncharacterized protein n=1 Tax=Methylophaga frappieri (strain ATCC BAA-2434 / DSM 25690 / JAM7) TaxID=754477 RepID=I1YL80_METFJ|nr:hypothetical protein Q7C_2552 [Methylophaga frappieri]